MVDAVRGALAFAKDAGNAPSFLITGFQIQGEIQQVAPAP